MLFIEKDDERRFKTLELVTKIKLIINVIRVNNDIDILCADKLSDAEEKYQEYKNQMLDSDAHIVELRTSTPTGSKGGRSL